MKIIVIGDQHFKSEEPFYSMQKDFNEWFIKQEFNNENNVLISTGDVFHQSIPDPPSVNLASQFFSSLRFKEVDILEGNHDYNGRKKTHACDTVLGDAFPNNILIKDTYSIKDIGGCKFLFMPFLYKDMKEIYESLTIKEHIDFTIGHFCNSAFFGEVIDISYIQSKKIMGHVHIAGKDYIGTPYITRYDERGKDSYIYSIDSETKQIEKIKCPKFLDYYSINYEDQLKEADIKYPIYDIYGIPSKDIALEKFGSLFIHKMYKRKMNEEEVQKQEKQVEGSKKTIPEFLDDFIKTNGISIHVQEKMKKVM